MKSLQHDDLVEEILQKTVFAKQILHLLKQSPSKNLPPELISGS